MLRYSATNLSPDKQRGLTVRPERSKPRPRGKALSRNSRCLSHFFVFLLPIDTEPMNVFSTDERRIFPHITLALFACLVKMSRENDIHDWYAVMEPALIRVFSTLGMNFIGIGPVTNYHGNRQPCTIKLSDLLDGVAKKNPDHWDMLTNRGQFK